MQQFFIIVSGPTGVGKTDFVDALAEQVPFDCAIINGDMGQMYTPLSVGTAKPAYKNSSIDHYLFDIIDEPVNYTVDQYRVLVLDCMQATWRQNKIPIIVGGSGFYLKSLFFAPNSHPIIAEMPENILAMEAHDAYLRLKEIDPLRASQIHMHDRYRLLRALSIWYTTGVLPSSAKPLYTLPAPCFLFFLERAKEDLAARILGRTKLMIEEGWIEEVASLSKAWIDFLYQKKIIGYPEISAYLHQTKLNSHQAEHNSQHTAQSNSQRAKEALTEAIVIKTSQYAKRQRIFFQLFMRELQGALLDSHSLLEIAVVNLTLSNHTLYLEDSVKALTRFMENL